MDVMGINYIKPEMNLSNNYPFGPLFVRLVRSKFKKQSRFVINGALFTELLTKDGWNPINHIELVIVSICSLLIVGDRRLSATIEISVNQSNTFFVTKNNKLQQPPKYNTMMQIDKLNMIVVSNINKVPERIIIVEDKAIIITEVFP